MVLDEEMEQAALKIQSTFRGHKTRKEIKTTPAKTEDSKDGENVENLEGDIANMALEENQESKEDSEEKTKEEETSKESEQPQSSNDGKTAQQLQDEEDIANLVMDAEMEKTALKIQSAFRGKFKRKQPKDEGEESFESSAEDGSDNGENLKSSDEAPDDIYEYFGLKNESASDERGNSYDESDNYHANRESYGDDNRYSVERFDINQTYEETIYPSPNEYVTGGASGGILIDQIQESEAREISTDSGSPDDDKNPNRNDSNAKKIISIEVVRDERKEQDDKISGVEKVTEDSNFKENSGSAEAMYNSLKKNEMEAEKRFQESKEENAEKSLDEDDDDVVVLKSPSKAKMLKYGMSMDDRLLGSILSQDFSKKIPKIYPNEGFNTIFEEGMKNHPEYLRNMYQMSQSEEDESPLMFDSGNMGDEDQFEDFYPGNIRSKIMASSISIADSDYFDPTSSKSITDDDGIHTALETIHSTDSESTIASATTKIHTGERQITRRNNNQYSSIGNAAIDKSLDDFIQAQEMRVDRFEEESELESAYNSSSPQREESVDENVLKKNPNTEVERKPGILGIKMEQKPSHFLTVDERRRTLHREDAIQRNSTRSQEEDSSKSSSYEKLIDKNNLQSDSAIVTVVQEQDSIIDTEIEVPGVY